jgi:hypothetical protein
VTHIYIKSSSNQPSTSSRVRRRAATSKRRCVHEPSSSRWAASGNEPETRFGNIVPILIATNQQYTCLAGTRATHLVDTRLILCRRG